jgi:hypothetical protein
VKVLSTFILSFIFHYGSLRRANGGENKIMTQDILEHLQNIQTSLNDLLAELDATVNSENISDSISEELESSVANPLSTLLDSFSDILESLENFDDVEYYNDPYDDEDDNY